MSVHRTGQSSLDRALTVAGGLTAGSWESVETLALLAIEARNRPEAATLLEAATSAASRLKAGTWESTRALTWLARAEREADTR